MCSWNGELKTRQPILHPPQSNQRPIGWRRKQPARQRFHTFASPTSYTPCHVHQTLTKSPQRERSGLAGQTKNLRWRCAVAREDVGSADWLGPCQQIDVTSALKPSSHGGRKLLPTILIGRPHMQGGPSRVAGSALSSTYQVVLTFLSHNPLPFPFHGRVVWKGLGTMLTLSVPILDDLFPSHIRF